MDTEERSKKKKTDKSKQHVDDLIADLQRTRADFENFRKRAELEREQSRESGKVSAILKLLPIIDNIERAITHLPPELADNTWAQGVQSLVKNLDKSLESLDLTRVKAVPGTPFDPAFHHAIQMEEGDGEQEVILEELQPGYHHGGTVIRHALVKVGRK